MKSYLTGLIAVTWLSVLGVGMTLLAQYEKTPGTPSQSPGSWPSKTRIQREDSEPTLLMFAHPRCPCTRASLDELSQIVSDSNRRACVVFYQPSGDESPDWRNTDLVEAVERDPRLTAHFDPGGEEAARFGATTSGYCVVYDRDAQLAFSGGVTPGRGHRGPSENQRLLTERLRPTPTEPVCCPAYGCPLH